LKKKNQEEQPDTLAQLNQRQEGAVKEELEKRKLSAFLLYFSYPQILTDQDSGG